MRTLVLLIIVCFYFTFNAQEKLRQNAPFTIRGIVGINKSVSSELYSTCFKGVVESNLSCNLRLFNNVFAGLGYQNSLFQNNKYIFVNHVTAKASVPYDTKLIFHSGFLKIGYDYFFSEIGYVTCAINTGYSFANYYNVIKDSSINNQPFIDTKFTAPYIQPELSINFIAEDALSFSFILSYTNLLYHFNPKAPRFNHFQEVTELVQSHSNKANMSWINIGFGFNILIK